jgi:isoleucyl-tRNA synthetase
MALASGEVVTIDAEDVEIFSEDIPGWTVANEGALTVALDITLTEDLRNEGVARELVKRIQNLRKSSGFEITDRIDIQLEHHPLTDKAVNQFGDYISGQVLANSITLVDKVSEPIELDFEEYKVNINIKR